MTQSSRNQPCKQTNNWQNVDLQGGTVVLHSKLELLWRLNGEKASLLLPRLSPVNSSLFLLENRGTKQPRLQRLCKQHCSLCHSVKLCNSSQQHIYVTRGWHSITYVEGPYQLWLVFAIR